MTDNDERGSTSDHAVDELVEPRIHDTGWPAFRDQRLNQFLKIWQNFGSGDGLPKRSDIDPVQLAGLLPHVWLYQYFPAEDRFFCEIVGETASSAWRQPMMKRWADEILDATDLTYIAYRWRRVMDEKLVLHAAHHEPKRFRHAERLALPMCDGDGNAVYVFGISLYDRADPIDRPHAPAALEALSYFHYQGLRPPYER